jgi:gliding motility-associated-like protein
VINVTATSNDGCVGPQSNSITFTVNPIPSVTLASSSDSICIGDNVSFTASPSGMNNYEFFNGSTSLQSGTSSSFSSTNFTAGSHNITVVATNLGCSSPASNVKTLTVISGPAVTLSSSDADNIICAGDTVTFTASPSGFANYDFYNGATLIQSGSGVTYTTSGLTSGNSITVKATNLGCPGPSSNAIVTTINAIPSSSLASNANTVCNGDNVTFTASPTGMSNYQFFVNGVSVQSGSGNTYSSTNMQNNDTVNVIVTNQGCSSTMSTAVAITVNPIPTVSLSVNPTEICDGQTAVFYASPSGYDNYQFFNNGNSIQNGTSDSLVATGLSSGNSITVIATDLGCSSPPSAPVSVIINTPPSPTITGTNIICNGDSTTLTAGNGTAYSWSNGSTTNPTTVAPTATTSYSVTVTDAKGCKGVGSITIAVIQHAGPELGPDIFVCNKQGKTLNAAIPGGVSYVWSPSAGLNSSTSPSPIANPDSTTTYFVTVTDVNGCKDTDSITVFPSAVNADAGDDVTINYGTGNPLAGSGGTQYSWSPAEGLSCTQCQNPIANPENTTTYSVTVTNDDGCVGTDKVTVTVIVTNDVFIPDAFSPNGDSQNDVLYVRGNTIKELYFAVFDRWGNKVFETTNKGSGWDGTYRGGNAEEGVYVYYLKATIVNGNLISKKGDVTLVR